MVFNLANMIEGIRAIDGVSFTDKDFFEYFFGTLALKMNITPNGKPLAFESSRISEVMNGKDNLYESIAVLANKPKTKTILMEAAKKAKKDLFFNTAFSRINEALGEMTILDCEFSKAIKEKSSRSTKDEREIFTDYLLHAMRLEYEDRQAKKKYKVATRNFVTKKADATICSELIEQIIRNVKTSKENKKHERPWSLEDKIQVNDFNQPLADKIRDAFDDFETVMSAIENLAAFEIQAAKTLYSRYQDAYCRVLSNLLGNDYTTEDIRKSSSTIFTAVDDYVYDEALKGKVKIEDDIVRCNLFSITVAVFYQCKILIKVEGERK